jgi:putative heme-binding domain-containing protein
MRFRWLCISCLPLLFVSQAFGQVKGEELFARKNLVAWCIVPFDAKKRGPEERAAMLRRLGFDRFAYDWRAEHVKQFDHEIRALARQHIRLEAFWFPATLNHEARAILDVLQRHKLQTQLWITMDDPAPQSAHDAKVRSAADILRPIALEAAKIGCTIGLYNHGGWFGEPENQLAIIRRMKLPNVGIVYNLHHGHRHLERFPELLKKILPHLLALNLNGMVKDGDKDGRKILQLGQGDLDLDLLRIIRDSGYRGPIGILGHTMDDAEERLRDNLDGLDWLVARLNGRPAQLRPKPRTPVPSAAPSAPAKSASAAYDPATVKNLLAEARAEGDARRGALVFQKPQLACISCHKIGRQGGSVGPDLSKVATCLTPEQIVEAVLWPNRQVKEEYKAVLVVTSDGRSHQGYKERESKAEVILRDPTNDSKIRIARNTIEEEREIGTLMPEGLAAGMTRTERRDLIRFLLELGRTRGLGEAILLHGHAPAEFHFDRAPLHPEQWPSWRHPVNRNRVYDFYVREAEYFMMLPALPPLLPQFPGMDGGRYGHWGNQNEETWKDNRWNLADLGSLMSGVFHGSGVTIPRGVCVRLGDKGEMAVCFNPDTLRYEVLWSGGFIKFSSVRHGFMHGLLMDGKASPSPDGRTLAQPFVYHGFYRHGRRVVFSYRIGDVEVLDSPWVENGRFVRQVGPAQGHPLAYVVHGGPAQWPQVLHTIGKLGQGRPYAVDAIEPPFENPWKSPVFFGDHDFYDDGTALICTMQGDVWRVEGLDETLANVRWRRVASGLHHALGLVIDKNQVYVLGRDQITRLHDLNGDGEFDFYECFSHAFVTSTAGHDFICGLQRDRTGHFYTASGNQGLLQISADGKKAEVLATGFRNPDGLGLLPDGSITVPCSEGEWTPASMICLVKPDRRGGDIPFFGYGGPRNGRVPELPMVYVPRGLDNSSGAQTYVSSDRWGPLAGKMIHFSYGAGAHFLLLREEVDGQPQGAIVPLPGEFLSGAHRGRFSPKDGQLYVSGMAGWGTYTVADACFQRVRYAGEPVQLPTAVHARENGMLVSFAQPVVRAIAGQSKNHFAQTWNYRYSAGYGSPEFSPSHYVTPGHDSVVISSVHVLPDGRTLFFEIPDLQPVNQLHLHVRVGPGEPLDLFATIHKLGRPFTNYPGYRPRTRDVAVHPILLDMRLMTRALPNPWRKPLANTRKMRIEAGKNLTFATRTMRVRAGEPIRLTLVNPDVVPHNWVLAKPGSLQRVGTLANKLIANPDAVLRHYVPMSDDVLVYTDIVPADSNFTIYFRAPAQKGRYPFLCTFPGHWMVMNGEMLVE